MNIIFQNNRTDRFIYAEKTHTKSNLLSLSRFFSLSSVNAYIENERKQLKMCFFSLLLSCYASSERKGKKPNTPQS